MHRKLQKKEGEGEFLSSESVRELPNVFPFSPLSHVPDPGNPTVEKGVIISKEAHRCFGKFSSVYKELRSQEDGVKFFPWFLFSFCPPITRPCIQINLWEVHSKKR